MTNLSCFRISYFLQHRILNCLPSSRTPLRNWPVIYFYDARLTSVLQQSTEEMVEMDLGFSPPSPQMGLCMDRVDFKADHARYFDKMLALQSSR